MSPSSRVTWPDNSGPSTSGPLTAFGCLDRPGLVLLGCYSLCDLVRRRAECCGRRVLRTRINTGDFVAVCCGADCCEVLRMD